MVFVPFSVPSFDGSTTQTVGSQSVPTFPALPSRLDFGSLQKTFQEILMWINNSTQNTYHWFAGQGLIRPVYATTTTDTIGASNTLTEAIIINYLVGYPITASASGTLSTLGFRAVSVTGSPHLNLALYSTYNSSKFSGLKCSTGSQIPVNGWNDWSCSGGTITATTTYYISYDGDSTNEGHYYAAGGTQYYVALAFASFPPDPSATLSSNSYTITLRMTYSSAVANSATINQAFTASNSVSEQAAHSRSNSQSATFGNSVKEVASHVVGNSLSVTFGSQVFRGLFTSAAVSQGFTFAANLSKSLVSVRSIASTFNFSASPSTFASHLRTDTLTVTFGNTVKEAAVAPERFSAGVHVHVPSIRIRSAP